MKKLSFLILAVIVCVSIFARNNPISVTLNPKVTKKIQTSSIVKKSTNSSLLKKKVESVKPNVKFNKYAIVNLNCPPTYVYTIYEDLWPIGNQIPCGDSTGSYIIEYEFHDLDVRTRTVYCEDGDGNCIPDGTSSEYFDVVYYRYEGECPEPE